VSNTQATIAPTAGVSSGVRVEGFASAWSSDGALVVGDRGAGSLQVADNGDVISRGGVVGSVNGGDGTVVVADPGSTWSNGGSLSVGAGGDGLLNVQAGGVVTSAGGSVGSASGDGVVLVEGPGSRWSVAGALAIGAGANPQGGSGQLTVGSQASVSVSQTLQLTRRASTTLAGSLDVAGATTLSGDSALLVDYGELQSASLAIEAGATLHVRGGDLLLDGELANAGVLQLQDDLLTRISALRVRNTGRVIGGGRLEAAVENNAGGEIVLEFGDQLLVTGSRFVNQGTVRLNNAAVESAPLLENAASGFINGRGSIAAASITNRGRMVFSGGQTDLSGDVLNSGLLLSTGGGTTTFFGDVRNQGGELRVSEGSFVVFLGSFNGSTTGGGTVNIEGILSPGDSPGQVRFGGDLNLAASAVTLLELGGTTAGQQYDQVLVGGAADLGGELQLVTINDYSFPQVRGQADQFLLLATGSGRSGVFETITYDGVELRPTFSFGDGSFSSYLGDGRFHVVTHTSETVQLANYVALPGDADGDLQVAFSDFVILSNHWDQPGTWIDGDFDQDGSVQFPDFVLLSNNYGRVLGPVSPVPEPAGGAWWLLAVAWPFLHARRRSA
jgi:MYXO-CTERM domain-containing protein